MNIDRSFADQARWPDAIRGILFMTRKFQVPIIVVRGDNPKRIQAMNKYLTTRKTIFVRLGVTCTSRHIYSEIASQLSDNGNMPKGRANRFVKKRLRSNCRFELLIIDNCQKLGPRFLFRLFGFAMKFDNRIKSILMFDENHFSTYCEKNKRDPRLIFLMNLTQVIYALPS